MYDAPSVPVSLLEDLERKVNDALVTGDTAPLNIIGQGEVSPVMELQTADGPIVCKRLPQFDNATKAANYRACLFDYIAAVEERGVKIVATSMLELPQPDGTVIAYALQPRLPQETLATEALGRMKDDELVDFHRTLFDAMRRVVSPTVGLDAQLANWMIVDGELVYIDITTPFLRDATGEDILDIRMFLRSMPWAVRGLVDKLFIKDTFDKFHDLRRVMVDYLGNLKKEGFTDHLPELISLANEFLDEPVTRKDVDDYYDEDAQMWSLLQKLRQADRWWQRKIRRRVYPFLLPEGIER